MQLIYYAEDDENIRELVIYALQSGGFTAKGFENSKALYEGIKQEMPSLILLDIMLPGEDGTAILRRLKASSDTERIPVIMLTAKSTEVDKVKGLDWGADDYITKPFGVMELLSRVKAVLRRSEKSGDHLLVCQDITLDMQARKVTVRNEDAALTYKEFELLAFLMKNKNIVLSREQLIRSVWGYDFEGETRTIDMHIKSLRQKLGDSGILIETIRGVGYKMAL